MTEPLELAKKLFGAEPIKDDPVWLELFFGDRYQRIRRTSPDDHEGERG